MGFCPILWRRCKLSTKAESMAEEALKIQQKGKFDRISYPPAPRGTGDRPVEDYLDFDSRKLVLNEIIDSLKDANLNLIGVYGMPGVGKSTFVRMVARKVKADGIFDVVVLANVSQVPDIRRIQGEIADELGFKLDAETVKGRADRLCERLKQEKSILIVLDNIWERLELEDVGIPSGSDHHECNDIQARLELKNVGINSGSDHRRCKILMTSRHGNVLSREMGAEENFLLRDLPDNEAWDLFEKKVGDDVKNPGLHSVASEVARRCAGLPLLLVTVARALRNAKAPERKDALKQLKRFDNGEIEAPVRTALELSFNSLKSDEIKSLFLPCGHISLPSGIFIDLLRYAMGLGFFKQIDSLEETRNRLLRLINDLKASCLLLEGNNDEKFQMHDVVRNFAISVASREHHVFTIAEEWKEWPAQVMLEKCSWRRKT